MATPVTVSLRGSFRTEVTAGKHSFVLDEPESAGGTDEGPTPYDALGAALGGCTAMTLHFYARREKFPLDGVDVEVHYNREHAKDCAECTTTSGYIHRFRVVITLHGDLTAEQRTKLLEIAGRCPVAKTLGSEILIDESLA
ncbi:MAG: OsmC family protein [Thermoanaerobaculia bacterium]